MPNKNKLRNLEKKRIELIQAIQLCDYNKNKTIRFAQDIKKQYSRGLLTYERYYSELNKVLKQRTPEQWIKYYDDYSYYYQQELTVCEKEIGKERNGISLAPLLITFFVLALLGFGLFFLRPAITGFAVSEPNIAMQEAKGIPKEMIMRTYSTEQVIRGNLGTITDYHELKYPIFNGTDYLSWEEGVDYQKTADGIKIKTADGIECTAKWSLAEENITNQETETVALSELNNKKLKHDKLKSLKLSYQKEVNETVEECNIIQKEGCENCTEEEICQNITNAIIITEYIDSSRFSIDMDKGGISLTDNLTEEITDINIEYRYYDKSKDIPLTKEDISPSKNRLDLNKGLLSDVQCSTKPVEHVSGDIYKVGHYYIDLDPAFYDDANGDWVLGTFGNTTNLANGNISLDRDMLNPIYTGSYTSSAGTGSIDGAYGVYVAQHTNGDDYAYVSGSIADNVVIINVTNKASPVNISNFTNAAPPYSVDDVRGGIYAVQNPITGDYYLYAGSSEDDVITMINITIPTSPVAIFTSIADTAAADSTENVSGVGYGYLHPVTNDYYVYTIGWSDGALSAKNSTNASIASIAYSLADVAGAGSMEGAEGFFISVNGNNDRIAYVTSFTDGYLSIMNVTAAAIPVALGSMVVTVATSRPTGVYVAQHTNGDYYAYVGEYNTDNMTIINVTNPAAPALIGFFNNSVGDGTVGGTKEVWALQNNGDNYVYVTNYYDDTLTIVNVSIPQTPAMVYRYNSSTGAGTIDGAKELYISGDYAYISAFEDDALTILNIKPYFTSGTYTSQIFNAAASVDWEWVEWLGINNTETKLQLAFRSCNDAACDTEPWSAYEDNGSSSLVGINDNQYFQYIANFTTTDITKTPLLDWVNISYAVAANQAPANPSQLKINSTTNFNYTSDDVYAEFLLGSDPEGDAIVYNISWYSDTTSFESGNLTNYTGLMQETLKSGNLTKGDNWSFSIIECDIPSYDCSSLVYSANITIIGNKEPYFEPVNNFALDEDFTTFTIDLSANISDDYDVDSDLNFTWTNSDTNNITVTSIANDTDIITFTSIANATGFADINITVWNTRGYQNSTNFTLTITSVNDAPLFDSVSSFSLSEDFVTFTIDLSDNISDLEDPDSDLNFTWTNSDTNNITVTSIANDTDIITFTSIANATGFADINITVWDTNGLQDSTNFTLTINAVNDAPSFDAVSSFSLNEDFTTFTIDLSANISDVEDPDSDLNFTWTNSDANNVTVTSIDNSTNVITFTSIANATGFADINITVWDTNGLQDSTNFTLTINAVNDAPWMNNSDSLNNVTNNEDFGTLDNLIPKTDLDANFSDVEENNAPTTYEIVYQSNSSTSCYFDGSNNWDCTSIANASGDDIYVIALNDSGKLSVEYPWNISINAVNDVPSIPELNEPNNETSVAVIPEFNWTNSTDIENDIIYYYLEIDNDIDFSSVTYANTSIQETANTTADVSISGLAEATYYWRVLAYDTANSSWSETRQFIYQTNSAPSDPTGVMINSTTANQLNYTDEDLTSNFLCSDPDASDTLTYDIYWYNGGIYNFSEVAVSCGSEPIYISHILTNENTSKGEDWSFSVNVTDDSLASSSTIFSNNLTIINSLPLINFVSLNGTIDPLDGGIRRFEFSFIANDTDGTTDLNSAVANVSSNGENYLNTSCSTIGDVALGRNYSCTIEMQYYFASGIWNYAAEIKDSDNIAVQNSTLAGEGQNWYYSQLVASNLSVSSLTWNLIPGATNQTLLTNPVAIENTGNKPTLNIIAQAIDLGGASGRYIPAANLTIGNITSAAKVECDSLNQTATAIPGVSPLTFINATNIYPVTAALPRAQGSKENLYYCLFDAPADLISEVYSTGTGTEWSINVE